MRLLAISGSLRAGSTNTALLEAAARLAPPGMTVVLYDGLGRLPIFNPDHDDGANHDGGSDHDGGAGQAGVGDLRQCLRDCDGVLIAAPEYAHGIPGGLKNALDWVVASGELVGKPVALLHASPRNKISRAALIEILNTMSAGVVPEASVTLALLGLDPAAFAEMLSRPPSKAAIRAALDRFAAAIARQAAAGAAGDPAAASP